MKKYLPLFFVLFSVVTHAQSATITPGTAANMQLPRLSYTQINAIPNPKAGMMVFDSTFNCLKYYNGIKWLCTSEADGNNNPKGFSWQANVYSSYDQTQRSIDLVYSIAADNQNNVYVAGWTGVYPLWYSYIAKFSSNGNLLWMERDESEMFRSASKVVIDNNQDIYVVSSYSERGYNSSRVLKYKPNGERVWVVGIGGERYGYRNIDDVFFDNAQNVYITGWFNTYMTGGAFSLTATDRSNFVLKVSNTGSSLWLKAVLAGSRIKVSKSGDVYFAGSFTGVLNVEGNNFNSVGSSDIVFGKYDTNGSLAWVKRAGGQGVDKASSLAIDSGDNLYVTGSFSGNAWFDTTSANAIDSEDYFLAKYRADGAFLWLRNGGGQGIDAGMQVEISPDSQPVILGSGASKNLVFYPNVGLNATIAPSNFIIKYNADNGDMKWVKAIEFAKYFRINATGDIYTLGSFEQASDAKPRVISKYKSDGEYVFRQISGALIDAFDFGTSGHFFFGGSFVSTTIIGSSILTVNTAASDIYVSHWIE